VLVGTFKVMRSMDGNFEWILLRMKKEEVVVIGTENRCR